MALNTGSIEFYAPKQYAKFHTGVSFRNQNSITFMTFFKVDASKSVATNQHAYVERHGTGGNIRFHFTPIKDKLIFGLAPRDGDNPTSYTYNTRWDDRWHHVAFSARISSQGNSTYEILLDGVSVADGTLVVPSGVDKISDTAPKGIYAGNHSRQNTGESFANNTQWYGLLDDIILLKGSAGQGNATSYFNSNDHWEFDANNENDPLIGYWMLNGNSNWTYSPEAKNNQRLVQYYDNGNQSAVAWAQDRPFLGDGLKDTTPPTTPGNPQTSALTHNGFRATWTASTDNVWVQFYELQVSEYSNFSSYMAFDVGRDLTKTVSGLFPNTNYYWRVRALDAQLNASNYSTVRSLTTDSIGDIEPPLPPTNLAVSYLTHSSFRIMFTPSVSNDAVGYKLDIATNAAFSEYLSDYKGRTLGNVTSTDVFGVQALTSYFVRVRAYDANDNESNDSVVIRVDTPRRPDTIPPLVVEGISASGVSATAALLSWEEGVDNVGVAGYYLDVSENPQFSGYTLTTTHHWQAVDVGNVTDYLVSNLMPDTVYYYRVRAYDDAGNVSPNTNTPVMFRTEPSSMYEGGTVDSQLLPIDWRITGQNQPNILEVSDQYTAHVVFDVSETVGSIQGGTFQFTPRAYLGTTTLGMVDIKIRQQGNPAPVATLQYNITQVGMPVDVDVSSLLQAVTNIIYEVEIASSSTGGFRGYIDAGVAVEDFNEDGAAAPTLTVVSDPMTSTQPTTTYAEEIEPFVRNLWRNPSFEENLNGWTGEAGGTITRVQDPSDGSYAMQVSTAATNAGFRNASSDAYQPDVVPLTQYTLSWDAKVVSGTGQFYLRIYALNAAGTVVSTLVNEFVYFTSQYNRYTRNVTIPPNGYQLQLRIVAPTSSARTFIVDNFMCAKGSHVSAIFNGTTSHARWAGVSNDSESLFPAPSVAVYSPYIGDSNENNSVVARLRHTADPERAYPVPMSMSPERANKRWLAHIPASVGEYNLIRNPSFELDSVFWTGGTRTDDTAASGQYAYFSDGQDIIYQPLLSVNPQTTYVIQAKVRPDLEKTAYITVSLKNNVETTTSTQNSDYAYGSGQDWLDVHLVITTGSNDRFAQIAFKGSGPFYIDAVLATKASAPVPYRDGDIRDGMWEGLPHQSSSGIYLKTGEVYEVDFTYTDPEGFFDLTPETTFTTTGTFTPSQAPDDVTTLTNLQLSATETSVSIAAFYTGDDNNNNEAYIEFKRTDLTSWSRLRPSYDRREKAIRARIPDLRGGTSYTVRVVVSDPDGVFGAQDNMLVDTITTGYPQEAVDAEPHVSFGGFVLMGRDDGKIAVNRHNAFGFPNRRIELQSLPRVDGTIELQNLWGSKRILIEGFISGDSRADLEDVRSSLVRGLAAPNQRLIIDSLSRRGRFYYATVESLEIEEDAATNITHLTWLASFVCADPFAYDVVETSMPKVTIRDGEGFTLVNEGDVRVNPYIEITSARGTPTSVTIVNNTTGERMTPKQKIIRGDNLIIDCERKSLTKNGVEIDYTGGFPQLAPGNNDISFIIPGFGPILGVTFEGIINVSTRWRNKYL